MIPFAQLNALLLTRAQSLVQQWIPGGKMDGKNYVVRNPTRNDREAGSFKIRIDTGMWKDFSSGDGGGDLISLFAYINRMKQSDAARELSVRV